MFISMQPPNNSDEEDINISHAVVSAVHWAAMFGFVSSKQNCKKRTAFLVHAMKVYRGSRGIVPLILNLGTRW
jgi:hypothetical protein